MRTADRLPRCERAARGRLSHRSGTYTLGERVELGFTPTLPVRHLGWLHVDVEADGDLVTVRARHEVFAHDGRTLIASDQVFEVERRCIFTVWP